MTKSSISVKRHRGREEVLADALHQVGVHVLRLRVDRALRVGAHDPQVGVLLLQVAGHARHGAAGAQRDHDGIQLAAGLLPDLRPGGLVVGLGVGRVGVLVGLEPTRQLLGQPVGHRVVALRRLRLDGGRADHHLGAVGPQQRDLLLAHLVGHDEDAAVALDGGGDRQADAGVAGGGLDDGAARPQLAVPLGRLDHGQADPVLDRSARVQVLELGNDAGRQAAGHPLQADQRGVADQVENGGILAGHLGHSTAGPDPVRLLVRPHVGEEEAPPGRPPVVPADDDGARVADLDVGPVAVLHAVVGGGQLDLDLARLAGVVGRARPSGRPAPCAPASSIMRRAAAGVLWRALKRPRPCLTATVVRPSPSSARPSPAGRARRPSPGAPGSPSVPHRAALMPVSPTSVPLKRRLRQPVPETVWFMHAVGGAGHGVHAHEQGGVAALLQEPGVLGPLVLDDELAVGVELVGDQRVERSTRHRRRGSPSTTISLAPPARRRRARPR